MPISGDVASLLGQVISLVGGVVLGRMQKTRGTVFVVSFLAGSMMMMSSLLYDGQGAFILLLLGMPLVYGLSVAGRSRRLG